MSNKRVGYLRLSDDDDCNFESMSIANQRKIISQYVNEHGVEELTNKEIELISILKMKTKKNRARLYIAPYI